LERIIDLREYSERSEKRDRAQNDFDVVIKLHRIINGANIFL